MHHAVYCISLSCLLSFLCNPYIPFLIYKYFHLLVIIEAVAAKRAYFGSFEYHPIHLDNVQCTGSEEIITQCSYVTSTSINCDHSEDAGVICGGDYINYAKINVLYVIVLCAFTLVQLLVLKGVFV